MANGQYEVGQTFVDGKGQDWEVKGFNPDGSPIFARFVSDQAKSKGFLRTAAQGATFGFSDELMGALSGLKSMAKGEKFGAGYETGRSAEQEALQKYRDEAGGGAALLAEGLGGMVTGFGLPGLLAKGALGLRGLAAGRGLMASAKGAKTATDIAKAARAKQLTKTGGGLGEVVKQGAKTAGIEGAIYGAGAAEGDPGGERAEERLQGAVTGGLLGGAVGGTLGLGLGAVSSLGKGLKAARGGGRLGATGSAAEGMSGTAMKDALDIADVALAKTLRERTNILSENTGTLNFKQLADEWINNVDKRSASYQKYLQSEESELFAGMMALANKDIKVSNLSREFNRTIDGVLGEVSGTSLLADATPRLRRTAVVSSTQDSPGADRIERLARERMENRSEKTLRELRKSTGADELGSARASQDMLEEQAKELNALDYENVYSLGRKEVDALRKALRDPPAAGEPSVIERLTRAYGDEGSGMGASLRKAEFKAVEEAILDATHNKNYALVKRLQSERNRFAVDASGNVTRIPGRAGEDIGILQQMINGNYVESQPALSMMTPERVDVFRRSLRNMADDAFKAKDSNLGRLHKQTLDMFDSVVDDISPKFKKARLGYKSRLDASDAYKNGVTMGKQSPANQRAYYDALDDTPVLVGRSGPLKGRVIKRSQKQMYRQGVLDNLADEVNDPSLSQADRVTLIDNRFNELFGPEGVFARDKDLSPGLIAKMKSLLAKGVDDAGLETDLKGVSPDDLLSKVLEDRGATEATAFGYAAAGQPGASVRTGLAGLIYGPGLAENVAGAFAHRLGTGTRKGLLDLGENLVNLEAKTIQGLANRHLVSAASGGATGGLLADLDILGTRPRSRRFESRVTRR